jgi:S1-C subfamily serine protease
MLHAWEKYGLEKAQEEYDNRYSKKHKKSHQDLPKFQKVVQGKINFLRMVKGESDLIYRKFTNKYCVLMGKPQKYFLNELDEVFAALWVLESPQLGKQGTGFMLDNVGLVTCAHVVENDTYAFHHSDTSKQYPVTIVAKNDTIDLAVLSIDIISHSHALTLQNNGEVKQRDRITLVGFPNYQYGDTPHISDGYVSGFRMKSAIKRMRIDTPIIAGSSGGPVLKAGKVIGVAVTGADRMENANETENHGVIPIDALNYLMPQQENT